MTDERGTTSFRSLSAAAIASSLHPDNAGRTDLISRIRDMSHRLGAEVFHRQSRLVRRDGRAELGSIQCPTLVIAGEKDRLRSRDEALELHRGIKGSSFATLAGTGHMLPLEAPDRFAVLLTGWLEENVAPVS